MTAALSANMFVSNMPVPKIMAWAKLGPVEKFIMALIVGTAITQYFLLVTIYCLI
jgi:hypothetical protein